MAVHLRVGFARLLPAASGWRACAHVAATAIRPVAVLGAPDGSSRSLSHIAAFRGLTAEPLLSDVGRRTVATVSLTKPAIKDPDRPKRSLTAWLHYLAHFREQHKAMPGKEVIPAASLKWKTLPAAEKEPFDKAYAAEQVKYHKEMEAYVSSGKKDAWERDPAKPKRPMNPFFRFAIEYRENNKALKITEATKGAKLAWDKMTEMDKNPYAKGFEQDTAKWKVDQEAYKSSGKEAAWQKKVGITAALEKLHAKQQKEKDESQAKKLKAKEVTERAKAKELAAKQKVKDMAARKKEKELAAKEKDKVKLAAAKEAAAAKKAKEAQAMQKAKEKELLAKAKDKQTSALAKAKEQAAKLKAKESAAKKKA